MGSCFSGAGSGGAGAVSAERGKTYSHFVTVGGFLRGAVSVFLTTNSPPAITAAAARPRPALIGSRVRVRAASVSFGSMAIDLDRGSRREGPTLSFGGP